MEKNVFSGWHLMLDAIVRDPGWIGDIDRIRSYFLDVIPRLGMELLDGPRITEVPLDLARVDIDEDDGGITGTCLITTSHLSIHTWPLRRRFSLDVFSCRPFDPQIVIDAAEEHFGVATFTSHWVERRWPDEPEDEIETEFAGTAEGTDAAV